MGKQREEKVRGENLGRDKCVCKTLEQPILTESKQLIHIHIAFHASTTPPFVSDEYHSSGLPWSTPHQLRSPHSSPGQTTLAALTRLSCLSLWLTPNTSHSIPHNDQRHREKQCEILRCPVGTGYNRTNLASLDFESPLNCVLTWVIILAGGRSLPVGFVAQLTLMCCLNTDGSGNINGLFAVSALVAHQLVFSQHCTFLLPLSFHCRLPLSFQLNSFDTTSGCVCDESINKLQEGNRTSQKILMDVLHCIVPTLH